MKYNTVLFDLDGTLTNPALGITNSVIYALNKFGITDVKREDLYKFIGPPLIYSFREYYGFDEKKALKAVEYYREYFSVKGLFENEIYDGITDLLKFLKCENVRVVLATSKPEKFAVEILKYFDIYKYFDIIAGATMDEKRNEKNQVIEYALSLLDDLDKSRTIMVGDRCYDIDGARQNKIDSLGVLYGFGDINELTLANATYITNNISEIKHIIKTGR